MSALHPVHTIGGYREFVASAEVSRFCEALWIHQTPRARAAGGTMHRVLPELGLSLAFQGFRDEQGRPFDWLPIAAGPKRRSQAFNLVPGRELAAIRIKPEWVGPLLDIDPLAVENQVIDVEQIHPSLAGRLREGFARTRSAEAALAVLLREMLDAARRTRTAPSAIACAALDTVRTARGGVRCERIADYVGVSERHFRRQVHDSTGVSPKTYARLLRFVRAMTRADRCDRPAWTDIAAATGYCDQSHLIRDAVALAGASPVVLHAERRRQQPAGS